MKENIFSNIPENIPEELFQKIVGTSNIRIERIISQGHSSEENFWYDQDTSEFVLLLQGKAKLLFDDCELPLLLEKGDYLVIPAGKRHRVIWTTPDEKSIWLAVHY